MISVACIASLTAILLHSLVDFNMYVPVNGLAVAWIAGIAGVRLSVAPRRVSVRRHPTLALSGTTQSGSFLRRGLSDIIAQTGTIAARP